MRQKFSILCAVLFAAPVTGDASQRPPRPMPSDAATLPAEEARLSTALFREGLKKRGLTDLLELHLKEYPPSSPSAITLMTREVKLAESADATRPTEERRAALVEANRLLERLIDENPDDPRRFEWLLTLAHSLLYQQGESYAKNILYFGGTDEDRKQLAPITQQAVDVLTKLDQQLGAENARIDGLSPREFETLETSGLIERLDRLGPNVQYLLLWARFYNALSRDENDPLRSRELNQILQALSKNAEWLSTPHERTRVQVPALLLAGMSARRLGQSGLASQHLERALAAAQLLADPAEREAVRWATTLAAMESARAAADDKRFEDALKIAQELRSDASIKGPGFFGVRLAAAVLERSIHLYRADSAAEAGRSTDARKYREEAWRALATLAAEEPENKSTLYATLYNNLRSMKDDGGPPPDPAEMCAWMAGLLQDAARTGDDALLQKAIRDGTQYVEQATGAERAVAPEILFNVAVARYRLGERADAAEGMLEVARRYPNFGESSQAALIAVQLSAQLYSESSPEDRGAAKRYRLALEALLSGHPNHESARYWQFYYAQLLEDLGEHSRAADEFGRVERSQEHFVESGFRRLRALARAAAALAQQSREPGPQSILAMDAVATAFREFVARVASQPPDPSQADVPALLAEARLLVAETYLLPNIKRPERALEVLADYEKSFGSNGPGIGRVWRARLRAYEAMGRLEEAAAAVPQFVSADPGNAGPTLQSLYNLMKADGGPTADQADEQGRSEILLALARQIAAWANREDAAVTPEQRREAALQFGEALLGAGNFEEAKTQLTPLLPPPLPSAGAGPNRVSLQSAPPALDAISARALYAHAQALSKLGDPALALPEFNRLAISLPPDHPLRWQALLGDLESRTAMNHPPAGILQVIAQQRQLFPDLGGPQTAAQLERLERENLRRRDQQP